MKSIIKIKINKGKAGMGRVISTIIICYVAVIYYPLDGIRKVNHYHYHHHGKDIHGSVEVEDAVENPEDSPISITKETE